MPPPDRDLSCFIVRRLNTYVCPKHVRSPFTNLFMSSKEAFVEFNCADFCPKIFSTGRLSE